MNWTLVTVTFNNAKQLRECWSSFEPSKANWIVVDNNSSDDSVEAATELGATVIERQGNYGFSSSNNVGLAMARTEYVAFVNPDVTIPLHTLNALQASVDAFGGLVAPQLLNDDESPQPNARGLPTVLQKLGNRGLRFPWINRAHYARTHLSVPTYVCWAVGAAVAARRATFEALGGWDDGYFIYYEDHDIGLRAWLQDTTVTVDPSVEWRHTWQRETTGFNYLAWRYELKSAVRFYRTYPELIFGWVARRTPRLRVVRENLWTPAKELPK